MNEQSYYIKHTADRNTATQFVFMQPIFKLATRWQTLAGRWYLRRPSSRGPSGETSQMTQIPFCQCCPTTNSGLMLLVKVLYFFQTVLEEFSLLWHHRGLKSVPTPTWPGAGRFSAIQDSPVIQGCFSSVQVLDLRGGPGPGGLRTSTEHHSTSVCWPAIPSSILFDDKNQEEEN